MLDYIVFQNLHLFNRIPSGIREILVGLPIVAVVCAAYWFIRRAWHKKRLGADFAAERRRCRLNELVRLLFVAWFTMVFLLCLTTDPASFVRGFFSPYILLPVTRAFYSVTHFDFIPSLLRLGLDRTILRDMFMNTVLFVPLGAALPILRERSGFVKTVLAGFFLTYFIEMIAQPFLVRNPSMDDIISNTLGTVIGYLLFMLLRKIFPRFIGLCQRTVSVKKA